MMAAATWSNKLIGAAARSRTTKRGKPRGKPKGGKCRKSGTKGLPPSKKLENEFLRLWTTLGGPPLEREAKLIPGRKYRVDFYNPATRIAYEIEGGVFCGGRHTRGMGFIKDCEKYNLHLMEGIVVYRIPGPLITKPYIDWLINGHTHNNMD